MANVIERVKDKFSELKHNPNKKKYFIAGGCGIGVVALLALIVLSSRLHVLSLNEGGASAGDLIEFCDS